MSIKFLHIGKTGGSAISHALNEYKNKETKFGKLLFLGHDRLQDIDSKYFFFVRNPVERFVSAYLSGYRKGQPRYNFPWSPAEDFYFRKFPTPNILAESLFQNLDANKAVLHLRHVNRPLSSYIGDINNVKKYEKNIIYVGSMENMNNDFKKLIEILDLNAKLPNDSFITHETPKEFNDMKYLSKKAIENVKKLYFMDYEIINYLNKSHLISDESYEKMNLNK